MHLTLVEVVGWAGQLDMVRHDHRSSAQRITAQHST
jgi:hypothetical protein